MKEILELLEQDRPEDALYLLDEMAEGNQENPTWHFYKSACYSMMNFNQAMLQHLRLCVDYDQTDSYKAQAQVSYYFFDQQFNPFFRRIAFEEEDVLLNEAVELMYAGEFEQATLALEKIPETDIQAKIVPFYLSICYFEAQDWEKALEASGRFKEYAPFVPDNYFNEGCVHEALENWEEAIECYKRATQHDSTFVNAYYNGGKIFMRHEDWETAQRLFDEVLAYSPAMVYALYDRAITKVMLQDREGAKQDLAQLLTIDAKAIDSILENELLKPIAEELAKA